MSEEKIKEAIEHRAIGAVYPSREALAAHLKAGKRFRIYLGVDATGPHIHLGHLTNLLVLKKFQEFGAEVTFLIGDFTAMIGDPTDKLAARQPLTTEAVKKNYRSFKEQAGRVIKFSGKNAASVKFNSKWLAKMDLGDVLGLTAHFTVQQMIERDMFQERLKSKKPIGLHEFLYPLLQGYDSVAMEVEGEIGGTDQTFNMLTGRTLANIYNKKEKFVITTKLLENPKTGKKLMNKSEGGTVNMDDAPAEMFGKIMALPDEAILPLAEFCTELQKTEILDIERLIHEKDPRGAKVKVAEAVTRAVYGLEKAALAKDEFEKLFSRREIPDDILEIKLKSKEINALDLALATGVLKSKSEARRLIEQGGFDVDNLPISNPLKMLKLKGGEVIKVGKRRFFRLKI